MTGSIARKILVMLMSALLMGALWVGRGVYGAEGFQTTGKTYTISSWQQVEGEWQCLSSDFYAAANLGNTQSN